MKKSSMAFVAGMGVAALMVISLVVFAAAQSPSTSTTPAGSATTSNDSAAAPAGSPVAAPTKMSNSDSGKQTSADASTYYNLYLQKLAADLGVSQDKLTSRMNQAFKDVMTQAVKDGKLTQSQADERSAQWADLQAKMFALGLMPASEGAKNTTGGAENTNCATTAQSNLQSQVNGAAIQALTGKLGITTEQLMQAIGSGKSIADLAASKNVSAAEIKTAVINAIKPILDQAAPAKTITQAQEDSVIQTVQNADLSKPIGNLLPLDESHTTANVGFLQKVMDQALQAAATKLGMTTDQLTEQLKLGKSLADIAASKNVSQADLKTAIINGIKPTLDQAVKDSTLTQQQEDAAIQGVQSLDLSQNPKDLLRSLGTADPKMCQ